MLQDDIHAKISRRAVLRLGGAAGAAAAAAPYLARLRGRPRAVGLRGAEEAASSFLYWPAPPITTRAQWGADESLRKDGQVYDASIVKLIVHHTGTPNDITDYPGLARSIMRYETSGEYIDIAYNWLIDPNGRIYEGRWATDYPAGVPHSGELSLEQVRGGHALNHNAHTIGIALMGTYNTTSPPRAMIDSLVSLLTWKCVRWGIDPLGMSPYVNSDGVVETNLPNIAGHRDTISTDCPGDITESLLPLIRTQVVARVSNVGSGYWIASSAGQALPFGGVPDVGDTRRLGLPSKIIGITAHPSGFGQWMLGSDGGVFSFGYSQFFGSTGGIRLNRPIVGMASTPSGDGYWLVAADGGVFSYGAAAFYGSTGAMVLNAPVLGMAATPTGKGYWLYARDGGIFSFGDAAFYGSTGGIPLNQPIVSMAARPQGDGYWLCATDGGVFSFGAAPFLGSAAGVGLSAPCVDMVASTTGNGYALLLRDGSVRTFGDAPNYGGAGGRVGTSAVGLAGRLAPAA